jgi:hypothetical protein
MKVQKKAFWCAEKGSVNVRVVNYILAFAVICGFWVAGQATRNPSKEAQANIMQLAFLPVWQTLIVNNYCNSMCDSGAPYWILCNSDPSNAENAYNIDCDCYLPCTKDTDGDGTIDRFDTDDDNDGFLDGDDPNPDICDSPCPNHFRVDYWPSGSSAITGNAAASICDYPSSYIFEFVPYYQHHAGGAMYDQWPDLNCNPGPVITWEVNGGAYEIIDVLDEWVELRFYEPNVYTITAAINGWNNCTVTTPCQNAPASCNGGSASFQLTLTQPENTRTVKYYLYRDTPNPGGGMDAAVAFANDAGRGYDGQSGCSGDYDYLMGKRIVNITGGNPMVIADFPTDWENLREDADKLAAYNWFTAWVTNNNLMGTADYHIIIVKDAAMHYAGFAVYNKKIVFINDANLNDCTLIHELGHCFNIHHTEEINNVYANCNNYIMHSHSDDLADFIASFEASNYK